MTRNRVQPYKNAIELPYASRKKIQTPPACGIIVANSEQQRAPVIVSKPATAHARSNQPGAPINRADSADVIKMPDPIIEPITIMVASIGPRARSKLDALLSIFSFIFLGQAKSRHLLLFCSFGSFGKFRGSNCYAFLLQMRPQHACKFYRSPCVTVDANRLRANIHIYVIDRLNFAFPQHAHHDS